MNAEHAEQLGNQLDDALLERDAARYLLRCARAENARLRAALEPFADMLPSMDGNPNRIIFEYGISYKLRKAHFMAARNALAESEGE